MSKNYKIIGYSFALLFLLLFININVHAQKSEKPDIENSGVIVNKNLDIKTSQPTYELDTKMSQPTYKYDEKFNLYNSALESCVNLVDVENSLLNHIRNRDSTFTINYKGAFSTLEKDLSQALDDIEKTDSYSALSYSNMKWNARGFDGDTNITFTFDYLTTKEQENYIDQSVTSIINRIIKSSMNDDDKEKAIHDYIIKNVSYDTSLSYYSAYDTLFHGKAVCQGYSLLAYKMLKQAGINVKIVTGTAGGEAHSWNLVYIRSNWYHLDCTWDDPIPETDEVNYDYYNINDIQMNLDHSWIRSNYPAASATYVYSPADTIKHVTSIKITPESLNAKVGQTYLLQAYVLPNDANNKNVSWFSSNDEIVQVNQDGKLKVISEGNAIITAKSKDGNIIGLCKVNVPKTFVGYKNWIEKNNVALNKAWTINFKTDIDANSINNDNLYIINETTQNKIALNTEILGNKVIVTPKQPYKSNMSYYLVVEKPVSSISGSYLSSPVVMKFITSSR